ncbi:hypothetical protein [Cellulophaga lytica]|uniref:Secreted protein n=1 Tax=Cellulophaga lytica (strain ATCC 23178 / DSM 7489 / JCM 8516 / NBRC 14961 / NCIMB 1423 / VKM B-1433 / Cy l20) TaxID=867900 RepID=F0RIH5_CELLC|nr:hypothetical protein [Cellulophaga lytica]ADY29304.1 hypothetical protein Celly_1479 [Cellulophaga lytica DSM 7489]WQG76521.1 hypothetical protein SR888_12590 [Cellulophaga lytica]
MLKNILLVLLLNLCFFSFGQKEQTDLSDFFSKSEIKDLNLVTDFFQAELCGNADWTKFGSCIAESKEDLVDWKQNYLEKKISWRKQKKLYSKISDSTFKKIWSLCKTWRTIEPKYEYKSICFSQNKKFIGFVNFLAESNPSLEGYGDKLELVGRFTPTDEILYTLHNFPDGTDLDNRGIQILLAIHFLTENDQAKRDKKAIRLKKRDTRKMERKQRRKNK